MKPVNVDGAAEKMVSGGTRDTEACGAKQEKKMSLSEYDKNHIKQILEGTGDWFTAHLLRLIHRAHGDNRQRLREAYPDEVDLVLSYERECPNFAEIDNIDGLARHASMEVYVDWETSEHWALCWFRHRPRGDDE